MVAFFVHPNLVYYEGKVCFTKAGKQDRNAKALELRRDLKAADENKANRSSLHANVRDYLPSPCPGVCLCLFTIATSQSILLCCAAVTMTGRDGRVSKLEQVYLRGSHIKLVVLPDVLKNAPVFKPVQKMKKKDEEAGGGRGGGFKKSKKPKA